MLLFYLGKKCKTMQESSGEDHKTVDEQEQEHKNLCHDKNDMCIRCEKSIPEECYASDCNLMISFNDIVKKNVLYFADRIQQNMQDKFTEYNSICHALLFDEGSFISCEGDMVFLFSCVEFTTEKKMFESEMEEDNSFSALTVQSYDDSEYYHFISVYFICVECKNIKHNYMQFSFDYINNHRSSYHSSSLSTPTFEKKFDVHFENLTFVQNKHISKADEE
jgi:hypothetical protein